ncbi:MAG: LysR family transcriptional regulator, partial [Pseudomonadota bacterium]
FSAAARATGTTQATISRRIKALEMELGGSLFTRGLEGVTLTALGDALKPSADRMADAAKSWDDAIRHHQTGRRTISVTCGELIGGFLSKHLSQLQVGLGSVDIELRPTNEMVDIARGEADLGLRNRRPETGPLKARRLKSNRYGRFSVFGAKTFFFAGEITSTAQLNDHAWIAHSRSMGHLPSAKWIAEHITEEKIRFRMNSTALILDATHANEALALLPRFIGLGEPHLVEVFGPVDGLDFEMWIVRRDEDQRDKVMEKLISNIEAVFV